MEQRPLRLGDTVDDYCPRERRVTNHVIVAIVEDAIRQTRCTTCDADHPFKGVREPRRRRKDEDALGEAAVPGQLVPPRPGAVPSSASAPGSPMAAAAPPAAVPMSAAPIDDDEPAPSAADAPADYWLSQRRLIRATLPRTENDLPPARPIPEFTMHQRPVSRGGFRHAWQGNGSGNGNGNVNGNGNANGNVRHQHGRGGQGPGGHGPGGHGHAQGQGPAQGHGHPRRHRGGKHRRPR